MTGQFEKLEINQELTQDEIKAINDLKETDELQTALTTEKIQLQWIELTFLEMANAFSTYDVKWDEEKNQLVSKEDAPKWLTGIITDKDENDFAYLIYKLSEILHVQQAGVENNKIISVDTIVQLASLKEAVLKTEVTTAPSQTPESIDITFPLYGVTKATIDAAVLTLQKNNPELAQKIIPLLKTNDVIEIQKTLGMKTENRTSLADYADGKFGTYTLQNLQAGKVVETKVSKSVPEDATPKKSDSEKIPATTDNSKKTTEENTTNTSEVNTTIEDNSKNPERLEFQNTIRNLSKTWKTWNNATKLAEYLQWEYSDLASNKDFYIQLSRAILPEENDKTSYSSFWKFRYNNTSFFFIFSDVQGKLIVTEDSDQYYDLLHQDHLLYDQQKLQKLEKEKQEKEKKTQEAKNKIIKALEEYTTRIFQNVKIEKILNTYKITGLSEKKEDYSFPSIYPFPLNTQKIMTALLKIQELKFTSEKAATAHIEKVKKYIIKISTDPKTIVGLIDKPSLIINLMNNILQ